MRSIKLLLLSSILFVSCTSDPTTTPTPLPSATPTPIATATPVTTTCNVDRAEITAYLDEDGRRNVPIYAWGLGQIAILQVRLLNSRGSNILTDPTCSVSSYTVWEVIGASCIFQGNIHSPIVRLVCNSGGDIRVDAHINDEEASAIYSVLGGELANHWYRVDERSITN